MANIPSAWRIANIALNDAMILPYGQFRPDGIFGKDTPAAIKSQKIARFPLDLCAKQSVCGGERNAAVDQATIDSVLMTHLTLMRERMDEAASIGRAAEACSNAGNVAKAIEIANDIEQLTYEVNTLLNSASLMNRIHRT